MLLGGGPAALLSAVLRDKRFLGRSYIEVFAARRAEYYRAVALEVEREDLALSSGNGGGGGLGGGGVLPLAGPSSLPSSAIPVPSSVPSSSAALASPVAGGTTKASLPGPLDTLLQNYPPPPPPQPQPPLPPASPPR